MTVRRIVTNIARDTPGKASEFHGRILGLATLMDQGWIVTMGSHRTARVQVSFASEGGSGTPVPDLSIEVGDLDAVHARIVDAGFHVTCGPVDEPRGVRRFHVRDPFGKLVNVLAHAGQATLRVPLRLLGLRQSSRRPP